MAETTATHRYTNRLADATSPYLLQHAHNPVDWYPWGPEALERARAEDKPIFLSIGYAACHWCHVMERESFEDERIAALMNESFVSIKVDREERPDLDDVYMAAVQAMTGSGGWPMSVFLTPEREPFFAGTYFPPDDRHGMPGFPRVLAAVAEAWRERRVEARQQARHVAAHIRTQLDVPAGRSEPESHQIQSAVGRLAASFDPRHGGFSGAPKFPAPMTLEFLLRAWRRQRDEATLRMVTVTLDRMAAGGIFDQLGGGFARYSTDAVWLVPHFEKMLYDNAQLAHCYLETFRATGEQRYLEVARRTLDFMLGELLTEEGGFASALDADSEGEEGRFYVWQHGEFMAVLAEAGLDEQERRVLAEHWGVVPAGNWEGNNVLHVAVPDADPALVERGRRTLLVRRERRVRPARDDKQVAAWNGMALRALAAAALTADGDRYLEPTQQLADFIAGTLVRDGDRLWRAARAGRAATPGFAEDYANVAEGLLGAHAALGDGRWLLLARRLGDRLVADFWDDASGTLRDSGPEHDATFAQARSLVDGATPSANSVAADLMLRLALVTGEEDLDRRARSILRAVSPALDRSPSMFGRMLSAVDRSLGEPLDAVVAASGARDGTALELRRAAARPYVPDLVLTGVAPGDEHAGWPLFEGKEPRSGRPTAYVCRGYACEAPTSDAAEARRQVEALSPAGS